MIDLRLANAIVLSSGWCTYCENDSKSIHLGYGSRCPACGHDYTKETALQAQVEQLEFDLEDANEAIKKLEEKLGKEAQAVDSNAAMDPAGSGVPDGDKT